MRCILKVFINFIHDCMSKKERPRKSDYHYLGLYTYKLQTMGCVVYVMFTMCQKVFLKPGLTLRLLCLDFHLSNSLDRILHFSASHCEASNVHGFS